MKKLLFIIFFPITIPIYLIYRFFTWFIDTFIPFIQYDVIPFFTDKLSPAIKKNIQSVKDKSAETNEIQNIISLDYNNEKETIQKKSAEKEFEQNSEIEKDNDYPEEKTIWISENVSISSSGITITGHLPPYTQEEYRKIRYYEALKDIDILKEYQSLDSFDYCYYSGGIYNYWGAKYRLLAIKCFEECLKFTPTVPKLHIYGTLAILYEKDHQFEKAVNLLQKHIEEEPAYSGGYTHKAKCLVKMGKIDEAIEMLNAVKETDYYKMPKSNIDPSFARSIDYEIEKCLDKKKRGYKFKPRKESFDYIDPNNFSLDEICNEYLQNWS